jgi:hypothetical protein
LKGRTFRCAVKFFIFVITSGLQPARDLLFVSLVAASNKSRFLAALVMTISRNNFKGGPTNRQFQLQIEHCL